MEVCGSISLCGPPRDLPVYEHPERNDTAQHASVPSASHLPVFQSPGGNPKEVQNLPGNLHAKPELWETSLGSEWAGATCAAGPEALRTVAAT